MSLDRIKILGTIGYMGGVMSTPEPFTWSWSQMVEFNHHGLCGDRERIQYDRARLSLHDYARNELAGKMLGDWLLMLDTDMQFEPDFAARLVRTMYRHDLDVVTGVYCYKSPPYAPVLYHFNEPANRFEIIGKWDRSVELFEVSSAGAGCLLIRRRALERVRDELKENPFNREGRPGEDHAFFMRLRKLGIKAYCAWHVQATHLTYKPVGLEDSQVEDRLVIGEYPVAAIAS